MAPVRAVWPGRVRVWVWLGACAMAIFIARPLLTDVSPHVFVCVCVWVFECVCLYTRYRHKIQSHTHHTFSMCESGLCVHAKYWRAETRIAEYYIVC